MRTQAFLRLLEGYSLAAALLAPCHGSHPLDDVNGWLVDGVKLAERSLGAVNVEPPKKRWGRAHKQWKRDKLSGYLTKYIGKEFEEDDKHAKKLAFP